MKIFQFIQFLALSICAAVLLVAPRAHAQTSSIAVMNLKATGLTPNTPITLSTGTQQKIALQSDQSGAVLFQNLKYTPTSNLFFSIDYSAKAGSAPAVRNAIAFDLNPFTGALKLRGTATRAASIVVNLSSEDSKTMVANQDGYFEGTAYSTTGLDTGQLKILASVINLQETCCPRAFNPYAPVTITISSAPLQKKADNRIIETTSTLAYSRQLPVIRYGVSVPDSLIQGSWIHGFRNFGNKLAQTLIKETASIGSFFDAQNNANAHRALQERAAAAARNYAPSEALCRYGSLSLSLSSSNAISDANKQMMVRVLDNQDNATRGSITAGSSVSSVASRINRMKSSTCDPTSGNTAVSDICEGNTDDTHYNADVDYTRTVDLPMTIDINFADDSAGAKDQAAILSLADTLFPPQPLNKAPSDSAYLGSSTLYRSLQAIRSVAKNSFATIVAEKARGTQGSEKYITNLIKALGVPEAQARMLMGENPSYFAQMEVLTKKLYQDPAFYVNLMDTPANIERQRASMRAIKLQQGQDFADTIKRREMLLAVLLELKIREKEQSVRARMSKPAQ